MSAPYLYDYINAHDAYDNPGTIHCKNSALQRFFARYLYVKCFSTIDFEGFPEDWDLPYFYWILWSQGRIAIMDHPDFGVIPQQCQLSGRGVFYQPTRALISNPAFKGKMFYNLGIDTECVLLRLTPDYFGVSDLVNFHADMLALSAESAGVNLLNTKLAYVFGVNNKSASDSMKRMYDEVSSGNPITVLDKNLLDPDGKPTWYPVFQDVQRTYIAGQITEDMAKWDARFNTIVGIPNVNIAKLSGVTTDEVNANNTDTQAVSSVWLDELNKGLKKVNDMFGLNIRAKRRFLSPTTNENAEEDTEYAEG